MNQRKIGKKIAAWLMCLAMVLTTVNLPALTTTVQAEESWVEVSTYDALKTELAKSGDKHIKLVADISNVDTINKNKLVHSDGDTTLDLNGFNISRVPEESTDDCLFSIEGGAICIINSTETKSTIYFENWHASIPRTIGVENGASLVVGKPYNCGPILVDAAPGQRAISTSGFTNMFSCVTLGTEVSKAQFLASSVSNGYINGPTIYGGINCQGNYVINAAKVYGIAESTANWALVLNEDAISSDSKIYVDNVKTDLTKGASSYYVTQGTMTEIRHVSHDFESVSRDEVTLEKPSGTEYFVCTSCGATKTEPVSFDCYAGSNCAYKFDEENKTLTIYGTGETKDYNYSKRSELAPWFIGDNKSKFDKVEKIVIEDGITSIGTESFVYLSEINTVLQEVEIGTNVVGIYNDAFRNCAKLSKINWPSSVSSIGTGCFSGNRALTNIEFPNNEYLTIGNSAFNNCGALTNIKIPGGYVQTGAFSYCPKLTTVTFGNKIKSLQDKIFEGDSELKDIYFEGNPPATFTSNAFYGVTATAHYPEGNSAWDSVITNQYGGTITWVSHTHSGNLVPQKDATCTEYGVKEHYECKCGMAFFDSACTREISDFEAWKTSEGKIEKKSHSYTIEETAEVPATCATDGKTVVMKCATCTATQGGETIPATGHSYASVWTSNEKSHWHVCTSCGDKAEEATHTFDVGKVTKEATESAEGVKTYTCKVCGYKKTETIAKLTAPSKPVLKAQKITTAKIKTYKASALKKKAVKISLKAKASGKGKLTYKVKSTPKGMKKFITVSKKGVVTIKKKAKKGSYKITITAAAKGSFKKATKTITIKVK